MLGMTGDPSRIAGTLGGAVGGAVFIAVVVVAVVNCLRRRRSQEADEESNTYQNTDLRNNTAQVTETSVLYAMPNKVKAGGRKKKKGNRKSDDDATTYENAFIGQDVPAVPPKIHAYLDDDLMEEMHGQDTDPTGGRIERIYETYYNTTGLFRHKVSVEKLAETVLNKSQEKFEEEFKKFADGLTRNYQAALFEENATKNRYKKVYPYDATRVVLKDGGEDYINASYIDGYKRNRAYIAALGPTYEHGEKFTLFWRMVWQEKVDTIVVLTKLMEGEKMKFGRYWPDQGQKETYENICVQTVSEECYAEFTIRKFAITKDSRRRTVHQAHFTAWPDLGVPDDVVSLLEFRHKVRTLPDKNGGPLAVHCSAGIGRTGTFIALDILIQEGIGDQSVDVYGCVNGLRGQRVNMVQNVDQYRYLHHALVHALTVDTGLIIADKIASCLTGHGKAKLTPQFQAMERVQNQLRSSEDMSVVKDREKRKKTRPHSDIPGDKHRPILTYQRKCEDAGYINAVFIDGLVQSRKFVVTQTPLTDTVNDFLCLIYQEQVCCVVSMDPEHVKDKNVGVYLPSGNPELTNGTFTIRSTKCETLPNFIRRELDISNRTEKGVQQMTLCHYQYIGWQTGSHVPESADAFVQTVREVETTVKRNGKPAPILVHCLSAAGRSGLFCTVSVLLEKLSREQGLSVVNTVVQVRSRRAGAIPTLEQYTFCHECVSAGLQNGQYSNVDRT